MSRSVIPPFRVLPASLGPDFRLGERFTFSSSGPDPGAATLSPSEYSLGHDSDWTADSHDLIIRCKIPQADRLDVLFGPGGITSKKATLSVALEWASADSAHRKIGSHISISLAPVDELTDDLDLSLCLPKGTIRGVGTVSIQVFLRDPGPPPVEPGMATTPGFRMGSLATPARIVIDADSSLFPILEQGCGIEGPLWEFREGWSDPLEDEFSPAYVSLVLNTEHTDFPLLREKRGSTTPLTPLFKQILASWIAVFVTEVRERTASDFASIVSGDNSRVMPGSIAHTAANLVISGNLDTGSLPRLVASAQKWIDDIATPKREEDQ